MIEKYISLLNHKVIVTCINGIVIRGKWIDCLYGEDASDEERQEDSILIANGKFLTEIYESEIKTIQGD